MNDRQGSKKFRTVFGGGYHKSDVNTYIASMQADAQSVEETLKTTINRQKEQIDTLRAQISAAGADSAAEESLRGQYAALETSLAEVRARCAGFEQQNEDLTGRLSVRESENADLKIRIADLEAEHSALSARVVEAESAKDAYEARLAETESAQDAAVSSGEPDGENLSGKLREQIAALTSENEYLKHCADALTAEQNAGTPDADALRRENENLHETAAVLTEERETLYAQIAEMQKESDALRQAKERAEEAQKQAEEAQKQAEEQAEAAQERAEEAQKRAEEAQKQAEEAQKCAEEMQMQAEQARNEAEEEKSAALLRCPDPSGSPAAEASGAAVSAEELAELRRKAEQYDRMSARVGAVMLEANAGAEEILARARKEAETMLSGVNTELSAVRRRLTVSSDTVIQEIGAQMRSIAQDSAVDIAAEIDAFAAHAHTLFASVSERLDRAESDMQEAAGKAVYQAAAPRVLKGMQDTDRTGEDADASGGAVSADAASAPAETEDPVCGCRRGADEEDDFFPEREDLTEMNCAESGEGFYVMPPRKEEGTL